MGRYSFAVHRSKQGKDTDAQTPMDMTAVREGRLKEVNRGLLDTLVKNYHSEQESVMMISVNLCAHLNELQKRESVFWEEVLRLASTDHVR
jgi:hypothetical protein